MALACYVTARSEKLLFPEEPIVTSCNHVRHTQCTKGCMIILGFSELVMSISGTAIVGFPEVRRYYLFTQLAVFF